jgi:hypothetical protein
MAWASMHFAVGMVGGGAICGLACLYAPRLRRMLPLAMTAGGVWAMVPDLPRIWREDFPSLPFARTLGSRELEDWLHGWIGDLFFFHASLDAQPHGYALHGLALIILLYNVAFILNHLLDARGRRQEIARLAQAHEPHMRRLRGRSGDLPQTPGKPTAETPYPEPS